MYIYICVLGSSARFARAMAEGIMLWAYIMGWSYGIISWGYITELYYGITLQDHITE